MKKQCGKTIWLTGLSGSGKSTLAELLKGWLESRGVPVVLLDGDRLRSGLNRDLGFSAADREENIRRAGETALLLAENGHVVVAAFITPLERLRSSLRSIFPQGQYVEVFLDCPLSVCEARDPKGLYAKARRGDVPEFTGVSSPFEEAVNAELVVRTGDQTAEESLRCLAAFLDERFPDIFPPPRVRPVRSKGKRLVVLGLDCVPASLAFGTEGDDLPILRNLMAHGVWGTLRSTDPPITLPAWTTITTGKDPGELGIYGFRNRLNHGYEEMAVVDSTRVPAPRVWNYLEEHGKSSILIGVPQTYPPVPHCGITVADFRGVGQQTCFTHPPNLARRIDELAEGEYVPDVKDFRTDHKEGLLADLYTMVRRRFRVASVLLQNEPWDFFMMVEMATDRLHHAFWRYWARDHRLYVPGNRYEKAIPEFYRFIDSCVGSLMGLLDDSTTLLIVSDHGARSMKGGVRINEWLIRNGYLSLRSAPQSECQFSWDLIDWSRTMAWSEGGYHARIFLNVRGREPQGIVEPASYDIVREEIAERLMAMVDETGRPMETKVLKPEQTYRATNGVPPDLLVYLDGLNRRSIASVGPGDIFCYGNDTGPDDANHDHNGIFVMTRMSDLRSGTRRNLQLQDVCCPDVKPTILAELGVPVPDSLSGNVVRIDGTVKSFAGSRRRTMDQREKTSADALAADSGFTPEEEEIVKKRLADLGYI